VRRGRQDGRPVRGRLLLLYFELGGEDCGRSGGDRDVAGFGAAVAVENFGRVAGGDDLRQGGERGADDVHATHKLIRAAVRKHFVNDERFHLEGLRLAAAGEGESAGDVVDQEAVLLALLLDEFDQLGAKLRVGERLVAFHQ